MLLQDGTVNVVIFAQYIFVCMSRSAIDIDIENMVCAKVKII